MRKDNRSALFLSAWGGNRLWNSFGLLAVLFAALVALSCSTPTTTAPLVRITLTDLPPEADKVTLTITANGQTKTVDFTPNGSDALSSLTIGFPEGTTGNVIISVQAFQGDCLVGSGGGSIVLTDDQVRELQVAMTKPTLACGMPAAQIVVQVVAGVNSAGKVTAVMPSTGIDCGQDCEEVVAGGTEMILHAEASQGSFLGWSGACSDTNDCVIDTDPAKGGLYTVQALFGVRACTGWCPDPTVPAGFTTTLYSIYGSGQNDIVAVGTGGAILRYDGTSWKPETSGVATNLYGVTMLRGSTPPVYVAVGDMGRVVYNNGGGWTSADSQSTVLRSVMGYRSGTTDTVYAVGDSGALFKGTPASLKTATTGSEAAPGSISGKKLSTVTLQVRSGSTEYLIAGENNGAARQDSGWDQTAPSGMNNLTGAWYSSTRLVFVGLNSSTMAPVIYSRVYGDVGFGFKGWKAIATENAPAGATPLRAVWGSAETNITAVGDGGWLIQYDGSGWNKRSTNTTKNLTAVWGTGAGNIYAVGEGGTILHFLP